MEMNSIYRQCGISIAVITIILITTLTPVLSNQCSCEDSFQMMKEVNCEHVRDIDSSLPSAETLMKGKESQFELLMNHVVLLLMIYGGYAVFKCAVALVYISMPLIMYYT